MNSTVIGNTSKIYVKPGSNTSYVLEITDNSSGCVNTDTIVINIRPLPSSSFTINMPVQCLGNNQYSFTNYSTGASSYIWYFGDNDVSFATNPTHSYQKSGVYTVYLTAISIYGCRDSSSAIADVKPHPLSSFKVNNSGQCIDNNLFSFTNTSGGAVSYFWYFGDNQTSSQTSPTHSYTSSGTFTVKLVAESSFGCKDSISHNVDVYPLPTANFSVNNPSQCFDNNFFIFTNSSTGGASYYWSFGDGKTSGNINPSNSYDYPGTYQVKLVVSSIFGCKDSLSQQVWVNEAPKAKMTVDDSAQCERDNIFNFKDLSTIKSDSIVIWKWSFGDGFTSDMKDPVHHFSKAGTYKYKLLVESNKGCRDSVTKTLFVFPQPKASFNINEDSQCLNGNQFVFTNTSVISSGTLNYFWDLGDGTINYFTNNTHSYAAPGIFAVKLRAVSLKNCSDSFISNIVVKPHPIVNLGEDDTIYNMEQKILNAGSGFDSYLWSTGDTTPVITVDSQKYGTGVFVFWVRVMKEGCDGYDSIRINIMKHVSLPQFPVSGNIRVFPNPFSHTINIESEYPDQELLIRLYDIFGREILWFKMGESGRKHYQLQLGDLPDGAYLLQITGNQINTTWRIFKSAY